MFTQKIWTRPTPSSLDSTIATTQMNANDPSSSVILWEKNHPSCRTLKPTGCKKSQVFQLFKSLTSLIFYIRICIYTYKCYPTFFWGCHMCIYLYMYIHATLTILICLQHMAQNHDENTRRSCAWSGRQ